MSSVNLQNTRLIYRSMLLFYTLILNYQKEKEENNPNLRCQNARKIQLYPHQTILPGLKSLHPSIHTCLVLLTCENDFCGTSLVVQWLRIRLPMQGTRVRALVREDPTCRGAAKPVRHRYWACTLEPASHNYWARKPQLLKPTCLEPVLCNKRSHGNEKPAHRN